MPYTPVETQIVQALLADATISGIVGSNIRGGLLQRNGAMPAIMYRRVSTRRDKASGSITLDRGYTGFCRGRFQLDHWSDDYAEACTLAIASKLVIVRLDLVGGGSTKANSIEDERDINDDPNQAGRYCRSVDAMIWFQEEGRDG